MLLSGWRFAHDAENVGDKMALPDVYVQVYGQVPEFFGKIQQGQAPDKFTTQHLKDIGYASSNFRAFIPLLKAIGFLTPDGAPTTRYHDYRSRAAGPLVMADALREAYSELFVINDPPTEKDRDLIEGKFKSAHNASDRTAELMARTFLALAKIADFTKQRGRPSAPEPELAVEKASPASPPGDTQVIPLLASPSLHYNIQIHLPATKDLEVYNAIFKSLKEHLLG